MIRQMVVELRCVCIVITIHCFLVNNEASIALKHKETPTMTAAVRRYGTRYWAVYYNGQLLAVTVYKKGALAVKNALESQCQSSAR